MPTRSWPTLSLTGGILLFTAACGPSGPEPGDGTPSAHPPTQTPLPSTSTPLAPTPSQPPAATEAPTPTLVPGMMKWETAVYQVQDPRTCEVISRLSVDLTSDFATFIDGQGLKELHLGAYDVNGLTGALSQVTFTPGEPMACPQGGEFQITVRQASGAVGHIGYYERSLLDADVATLHQKLEGIILTYFEDFPGEWVDLRYLRTGGDPGVVNNAIRIEWWSRMITERISGDIEFYEAAIISNRDLEVLTELLNETELWLLDDEYGHLGCSSAQFYSSLDLFGVHTFDVNWYMDCTTDIPTDLQEVGLHIEMLGRKYLLLGQIEDAAP